MPPLGLKPSKLVMFGRTHLYQVPANPVGTVVVFPGCARSAQGFWPYDKATAPTCLGFPEDVSHAKQILLKGYAIIVLTPIDTKGLCWSMKDDNASQVADILERFLATQNLKKKPLFFLGASSGAGFAIRMPEHLHRAKSSLKIHGIISEVGTNISPIENGKPAIPNFPPTIWVVMERDQDSQKEARSYVSALSKNHVAADFVVSPIRAVTPEFLANRIPSVSIDEAKELVQGMRKVGLLDEHCRLVYDPKAKGWEPKLKKLVPSIAAKRELTLAFRKSPLWQALLMAYAKHEHISDFTTPALAWLESDGKANFDDLVKKLAVSNPSSLKL